MADSSQDRSKRIPHFDKLKWTDKLGALTKGTTPRLNTETGVYESEVNEYLTEKAKIRKQEYDEANKSKK